jgi:hypothetical protein
MKKQALLFIAGGLMALASCTTETHDDDMSQAQIDSTVNARVEEIRMEMMRQNDSLINAMAVLRADSILAAMKGGSSVTTKTTTTRTTKVNPATSGGATSTSSTSTTDKGGIKSMSDQNQSNTKDRVKSMSDKNEGSTKDKIKSMSDKK